MGQYQSLPEKRPLPPPKKNSPLLSNVKGTHIPQSICFESHK
ncbi:hypothetical protein A9K97_gp246 [Tokyovirus A1]|nr:hypothetical protein A9K97_gp246 [Tokyovirus A1]BAU80105.1 hypothetical protein [Tokyovirus A1]